MVHTSKLAMANDNSDRKCSRAQAAVRRLGLSLAPFKRVQKSLLSSRLTASDSLTTSDDSSLSSRDLTLSTIHDTCLLTGDFHVRFGSVEDSFPITQPSPLSIMDFELNGTRHFSCTKDTDHHLQLDILPRTDCKRNTRTKRLRTRRRQVAGVENAATLDSLNRIARGTFCLDNQ
jgi:hypothetical protein